MEMIASMRVKGVAASTRQMAALGRKMRKALKQAVYDETIKIADKSLELVPIDTTALATSQKVNVVAIGGGFLGTIDYRNPYAIYVHEIPPPPQKSPGGRSARHIPPRQWKYLEIPLKRSSRWYEHNVQKRMERLL